MSLGDMTADEQIVYFEAHGYDPEGARERRLLEEIKNLRGQLDLQPENEEEINETISQKIAELHEMWAQRDRRRQQQQRQQQQPAQYFPWAQQQQQQPEPQVAAAAAPAPEARL